MLVSPFYDTAPEHASERAMASYALLDSLHIPYQRIEHEKAETMEVCAAVSDALGVRICKNLFLCNRQKTSFYLLMMPGEKVFKTKDLSKQLGVARLSFASPELSHQIGSSRLSFAPPEKMEELLGCSPGSASVLGLHNDSGNAVRLVMDRDVYTAPYFACHPCDNTQSLKFKTEDLLNVLLPKIGHEPIIVDL